jgi:hypothetical protein
MAFFELQVICPKPETVSTAVGCMLLVASTYRVEVLVVYFAVRIVTTSVPDGVVTLAGALQPE